MSDECPYHEGELQAQSLAGEQEKALSMARVFRDALQPAAMDFIGLQPMCVIASMGKRGEVWASILTGAPGFVSINNSRCISIDLSMPRCAVDDPLWRNLDEGGQVGILFIEFSSRRRLRVNGRAQLSDGGSLLVNIDRTYGNCPRNITRRFWQQEKFLLKPAFHVSRKGLTLTARQCEQIQRCDTFFVASAAPQQGLDVSHRGGAPGFITVESENRLRIPDFEGNGMFNTLGNFLSHPQAGLAFIDFARGQLLQLTGRAVVEWHGPICHSEGNSDERAWFFDIDSWRESGICFPMSWHLAGAE